MPETATLCPVRCPRCRILLATTDGERLYLGAAWTALPFTVNCGCGGRLKWLPRG